MRPNKPVWKDVTSYSQGDTKRLPTCWTIYLGEFKVSLVWNSLFCPGTWSTTMHGMYDKRDLGLPSYDYLKRAQGEAILIAKKVFEDALSDAKRAA